ncbi:hypothetical protein F5Y09DRAFT_329403 [Xylaria sp. FL1042]|nr:hypothetical protein F5Y09DRAFT_329403 [Xylaria sp. FL1042]
MPLDKKPTLTPALQHLPESGIDRRTDAEIAKLVDTCRPVKHENNFPMPGAKLGRALPALTWWTACQNHALNFIGAEYLPNCVVKNTMTGKTSAQHASDITRQRLVYLMFLINSHSRPYEGQILDDFIGAHKNNLFVERWQRVFFENWKDHTNCVDLHGANVDRVGISGPKGDLGHVIADYLSQECCFEPILDAAEDWNGPAYYRKNMCFLNAECEYWKCATLMPTEMHIKLMSLLFKPELTKESEREDAPGQLPGAAATPSPDEARLQQATRDWSTNISSSYLAVKFSDGYWWPGSGWAMPLAMMWALGHHEDDEIMPETRAERFRYGSTPLPQTRKVPIHGAHCQDGDQSSVLGFLATEAERVLHAGLLEPVLESDNNWEFIPPFGTVL